MESFNSGSQRSRWMQRLRWPFARVQMMYWLFLIVILAKLMYLQSNIQLPNFDMNDLDKVTAVGSIILASFWVMWLPKRGRIIALIVLDVLLSLLIF